MKIRVKNKHLILITIFAVLALGFVQLAGGDYLFLRAESSRRRGDEVKALAYYDALIDRYPEHARIPEALYWSASLIPGFDVFSATFFPSSSTVTRRNGGIPELAQGTFTKEERYRRILQDYPDHSFGDHVIYRLAEMYENKGDTRSEALYLETLQSPASFDRVQAAMRLIGMYLAQNRLEEALATITYCQLHLPNHLAADIQMRLGDVYTAMGDYVAARAAYEAVVPIVEEQVTKSPSLGMAESTLVHYKDLVAEKLAELAIYESVGSKEQVSVAGRVTIHGQPLAGVQIYANQMIGQTRYYLDNENPGLWVTTSDGSFGGRLLQGVYEFGIRLDYEQAMLVEGTHLQIVNGELELSTVEEMPLVEFRFVEPLTLLAPGKDFLYQGGPIYVEWDDYAGASAYGVSMAGIAMEDKGYSSTGGKTYKTEDTNMLLNLATIAPFGFYGYDQKGIHPTYLLDHPSVYDRLRITVQALDQEGAVLSSSSGLVFSDGTIPGEILVQKSEATQVHKLINARQYGEAVKLLEKQVENDPKDLESLWILARIYFYGTHTDEWHDLATVDVVQRDREKSLQILRRIQEIDPSSEVEEALDVVLFWIAREK